MTFPAESTETPAHLHILTAADWLKEAEALLIASKQPESGLHVIELTFTYWLILLHSHSTFWFLRNFAVDSN